MAGEKKVSHLAFAGMGLGVLGRVVYKRVPETELCKWWTGCRFSVLAYEINMPSNSRKKLLKRNVMWQIQRYKTLPHRIIIAEILYILVENLLRRYLLLVIGNYEFYLVFIKRLLAP